MKGQFFLKILIQTCLKAWLEGFPLLLGKRLHYTSAFCLLQLWLASLFFETHFLLTLTEIFPQRPGN